MHGLYQAHADTGSQWLSYRSAPVHQIKPQIMKKDGRGLIIAAWSTGWEERHEVRVGRLSMFYGSMWGVALYITAHSSGITLVSLESSLLVCCADE